MHLDLNLLVALDALLDEGSVGAAAQRLELSQPAMSRTLGRIRRATGDEILVRSGRVMLPTPYAEEIRAEVHALVAQAQAVFTPAAALEPAALRRTFTLLCNDVVASALVPPLSARISAAAPGVGLRVLGETHAGAGELRRGEADLQLTGESAHPAGIHAVTVVTDRLAVIARPGLDRDPATLAGFAARPHVVISRRGRFRDRIDDLLEARGHSRRVALTVPTLALALRAVAASDGGLITVAPAALAGPQLGPELRAIPLPLSAPPVTGVMAWHVRHDRDSAHRWLRTTVTATLAEITRAAA